MAEFAHNTETGQNFYREREDQAWQPVSREAAEKLQQGISSAGTGFGRGITDAIVGGLEGALESNPITYAARQAMDWAGVPENAPARAFNNPLGAAGRALGAQLEDPAAREAAAVQDPEAYQLGQVGAFGASMLAPGAGAGLARRGANAAERVAIGTHEAGVRARLAAAARRADEAPVQGAERVTGGERPNLFAEADDFARQLDDVRGAPGRVSGIQPAQEAEAARGGLAARLMRWGADDPPDAKVVKRAEDLGFKLTPADRLGGIAPKNMESAMKSNPAALAVFEREILAPNAKRVNQLYADAIGLPRNKAGQLPDAVTPDLVADAYERIQRTFRTAAKQVDDRSMGQAITDATQAVEGVRIPTAKRALERVINDMPSRATGQELLEVVSQLRKEAVGAATKGEQSYADGLEKIADRFEDELMKGLRPSTRKSVQEARERWRMLQLGQKGRAVTETGDVSLNGMAAAARTSRFTKNAYRQGRKMKTEAASDFMDALRTMQHFRERVGDSGTATRSTDFGNPTSYLGYPAAQAYLGKFGKAGTAVGLTAAGGAGVGGILGD